MKAKYTTPITEQMTIEVERLISESTTSQKVYTDDSQSAGNALTKENSWGDIWDN